MGSWITPYPKGLLQPLTGLVQARTARVLHLTALNPHIATVMRASGGARGNGRGPYWFHDSNYSGIFISSTRELERRCVSL